MKEFSLWEIISSVYYKFEKRVVLLVDEYDKPLTESIWEKREIDNSIKV
jgi:hypothetical protein